MRHYPVLQSVAIQRTTTEFQTAPAGESHWSMSHEPENIYSDRRCNFCCSSVAPPVASLHGVASYDRRLDSARGPLSIKALFPSKSNGVRLDTRATSHLGQERHICVDRAMSAVPPLTTKMLSRSKRATAVIRDLLSAGVARPPWCTGKYHSAASGCCTVASMLGDR